jgi:hypothetical protein
VLNRLDAMHDRHEVTGHDLEEARARGRYYLQTAGRRIRRSLADLWDNDDEATTQLADRLR